MKPTKLITSYESVAAELVNHYHLVVQKFGVLAVEECKHAHRCYEVDKDDAYFFAARAAVLALAAAARILLESEDVL